MQSSSSSQHQRSKSTGCMSGILQLITRHHHHHSRSRKRLPSAPKKRDKSAVSPEKRTPPPKETTIPASIPRQRTSCDAPRSPTLPAELRRAGPPASPDSPRRPSALVARLMGLDETPVDSPRSTAEKRRKLLGALEKCDEDLRALKRIIEAVQTAEVHKRAAAAAAAAGAVVVSRPTVVKEMDGRDSTAEGDQPSPVSVLDALPSPRYQRPHRLDNGVHTQQPILAVRSRIMERRGTGVFYSEEGQKKARRADENRSFFRRVSMDELPRLVEQREGESLIDYLGLARWRVGGGGWRWRRQRSRAMVESVEEVWAEGVWEEKWEFGRIGVMLESEIFGDLVEEVVMEMLSCCYKLSLPLGTCKKRLYF